jgi:hypothetical protein
LACAIASLIAYRRDGEIIDERVFAQKFPKGATAAEVERTLKDSNLNYRFSARENAFYAHSRNEGGASRYGGISGEGSNPFAVIRFDEKNTVMDVKIHATSIRWSASLNQLDGVRLGDHR